MYVIDAVVVTVVVVVFSGGEVSATVVVTLVAVVSALELSLFLEIVSPLFLILDRLAVVDLLNTLYIRA